VVLGCTHYPFVAHHIAAEFGPQVQLIDTADAVAQRTLHLARTLGHTHQAGTTTSVRSPQDAACTDSRAWTLRLWTSGEVATLQRLLHDWLGLPGRVLALPTEG
jgi:glutamate racemase